MEGGRDTRSNVFEENGTLKPESGKGPEYSHVRQTPYRKVSVLLV